MLDGTLHYAADSSRFLVPVDEQCNISMLRAAYVARRLFRWPSLERYVTPVRGVMVRQKRHCSAVLALWGARTVLSLSRESLVDAYTCTHIHVEIPVVTFVHVYAYGESLQTIFWSTRCRNARVSGWWSDTWLDPRYRDISPAIFTYHPGNNGKRYFWKIYLARMWELYRDHNRTDDFPDKFLLQVRMSELNCLSTYHYKARRALTLTIIAAAIREDHGIKCEINRLDVVFIWR